MSILDTLTVCLDDRGMQGNDSSSSILWVSAHPEPRSLNGSLRSDGIAHLRRGGHSVLESDLYAMDWDPVVRPKDGGHGPANGHNGVGGHNFPEAAKPFHVSSDTRSAYLAGEQPSDIAHEQAKLLAAEAIVIQFPLWWYGMPAILKGWFDRVFVSGFAFGSDPRTGRRLRFEQGPFVGKRALVLTTLGDRPKAIGPRGKSGELNELLFGLLHGTFAYTGMNVMPPLALPSADRLTDYGRAREELLTRLDRLFIDPEIPYRPQFAGEYSCEWELEPHVRPGEHGVRIHTRN